MVQKTLDTARAAFNNIKPVDGKGERKSRKAFQAICDRIYGHVKDEYERNIARKEALVNEAKSLAEVEELREAISRAKDIQRDWKVVGMTPRQVDRKLWKELRAACDVVFGRLDEQRKVENTAKNERAEQAKLRARKERDRWPRLLDRMQACALKTEDEEKATGLWEQDVKLPPGIDHEALGAWWEDGSDPSAPEDALRQACIAMEILLEVDSPPEDKEARMAYQMQRLLEGMGSAQGGLDDRLVSQINEFIALRPPASWLDRFCCDGKIIPQKARTPG
jgi:exonuclease SbcC